MRQVHALTGIVLATLAGTGWSATVVAGPASCSAAQSHPFYPTIQAAINAAPSGSTVLVCPGTYPEQVSIAKDLTLKGVADTNTNTKQAVIAIPPGTLSTIPSAGGGSPIAAQVAVTGGAKVGISDLTIDGAGNAIADCITDLVGVLFQNSSGSLKSSQVINQLNPPGYQGCQGGLGVYVQTDGAHAATVKISGNRVANFNKNGITANGAQAEVTITDNSVTGLGPTDVIAQNGIQVSRGAHGSVAGNDVSNVIYTGPNYGSSGIIIYDSPDILIDGNSVNSSQLAVEIYGDGAPGANGATITGNRISETRTYDAIDLCGSNGNTVFGNTVRGTDEAAIHIEGDTYCGTPSTGNTVSKNTLNGACAGLLVGPGADVPSTTNTFFNVATQVLTGSDVCPAGENAVKARKHRQPSPLKVQRAG